MRIMTSLIVGTFPGEEAHPGDSVTVVLLLLGNFSSVKVYLSDNSDELSVSTLLILL